MLVSAYRHGRSSRLVHNAHSWKMRLLLPVIIAICDGVSLSSSAKQPWRLLAVDDELVAARSANLRRQYHKMEKHPANPVMTAELPYTEPNIYVYGSVWPAQDRAGILQMYYSGLPVGPSGNCTVDGRPYMGSHVLYAESSDGGVRWTRPLIRQREWCATHWTQTPHRSCAQ